MSLSIRFVVPLAAALSGSTPAAQGGPPFVGDLAELFEYVREGDSVPGVGLVTSISNIAVNDDSEFVVEVDTDHADTDADSVVLKNGVLFLREGQALAEPPGALLDSFDAITLSNTGESAWNFFLDPFPAGFDSGVYFDTDLLIQEGDVSGAPGFAAGTTYEGFFETKVNSNKDVLVLASVDDPSVASTIDQALVLLEVNASNDLVSETVVAKEGDVLPGQTEAIETFETGPHNFDMNAAGDVLFIAELTGDASQDHVAYLNAVAIAQEGSEAAATGRNWSSLSLAEVDLNNGGDWVLSGSLEGDASTNLLIVRNDTVFRQEGDTLDAIAPFTLTSFGSGPVHIDDKGGVLWYGDWNDPDTDVDTGLFYNDTLLVQEGVTMIGGDVIDTLRGIQDGYTISDNGRYIAFEAVLADGTEVAVELRQGGAVEPMSDCGANAGSLSHAGGTPFGGDVLGLEMDAGQAPGAAALLWFAIDPIPGWPPCGIDLGQPGELLISLFGVNPIATFSGTWTGAALAFGIPIPAQTVTIGLELYTQGIFVDFAGAEVFRLTNGLAIVLGDYL